MIHPSHQPPSPPGLQFATGSESSRPFYRARGGQPNINSIWDSYSPLASPFLFLHSEGARSYLVGRPTGCWDTQAQIFQTSSTFTCLQWARWGLLFYVFIHCPVIFSQCLTQVKCIEWMHELQHMFLLQLITCVRSCYLHLAFISLEAAWCFYFSFDRKLLL
jgi:hypothetical protein